MESVRFTCQPGCIKCCDQEGYVYLTEEDLARAAEFTGMTAPAFEAKYVLRTGEQLRFRKPRRKQCPFLLTDGCGIHPAKPSQCRTFPFWPELLERKRAGSEPPATVRGFGKGELIQIGDLLAR